MFSERLLDIAVVGDEIRPRYLGPRDELWVERALDLATACVGRPAAEVERRFSERPNLGERRRAWQALTKLLLRHHGFAIEAAYPPRELRARVFARAASSGDPAPAVLAAVGAELGLTPEAVARALYADIPPERVLCASEKTVSPRELTQRYNLALAQGLLLRAESLAIHVESRVKAVLRFARLQRLLCAVRSTDHGGAKLVLSGPLSLFRHTMKYGRAMAAWLPVLGRAPRWRAQALCVLRGQRLRWRASYRDPIATTHGPQKRFDSEVEARLFRQLEKRAPEWEVLREADPVQIGRHIVCPDFTLVHPGGRLRVPVEIVGFWTPRYLREKLAVLRQLPRSMRWLLCVDASLGVAEQLDRLPSGPVFSYRRRIDVGELLAFIDAWFAAR